MEPAPGPKKKNQPNADKPDHGATTDEIRTKLMLSIPMSQRCNKARRRGPFQAAEPRGLASPAVGRFCAVGHIHGVRPRGAQSDLPARWRSMDRRHPPVLPGALRVA